MKTLRHIATIASIAWFLANPLAWTGNEIRIFTDMQGRRITGRLMDFNDIKQIATIRRAEDKKDCEAPLTSFSEADQQYIREMASRYAVGIRTKLLNFNTTQEISDASYAAENIECFAYKVILENRTRSGMDGIVVEYCIFYEQRENKRGKISTTEGIQCGSMKVDSFPPGSIYHLTTKQVWVYDKQWDTSKFGSTDGIEGRVTGILLQIVSTTPSGEIMTWDYCYPDNIKGKQWTSTPKLDRLNRVIEKSSGG